MFEALPVLCDIKSETEAWNSLVGGEVAGGGYITEKVSHFKTLR